MDENIVLITILVVVAIVSVIVVKVDFKYQIIKKQIGFALLVIAFELASYVLSDFFFAVQDYDKYYFNERLFIALNTIGLSSAMIVIAINILKAKDSKDK